MPRKIPGALGLDLQDVETPQQRWAREEEEKAWAYLDNENTLNDAGEGVCSTCWIFPCDGHD